MTTNPVTDADQYIQGLFDRQEARQAAADAMQAQTNKVCTAIRACDLNGEQLRQILSTLACRMKAVGYSDSDIELLETGSETIV